MLKKVAAGVLVIALLSLTACETGITPTSDQAATTGLTTTTGTDSTTTTTTITTTTESTTAGNTIVDNTKATSTDEPFTNDILPEDTNNNIPGSNSAERLNPQTGGADKEAAALRDAITGAKDKLKTDGGKVYYISAQSGDDINSGLSKREAWKSLSGYAAWKNTLKAGDTVMFERGSVYRGDFALVSGVSYGAYGTGSKPAIYGSEMNYSGEDTWNRTETENIWVCAEYVTRDVGAIVFNHGMAVGVKITEGVEKLSKNFQFYQDLDNAQLYLYLEQDPGTTFYDIEICDSGNVIQAPIACNNVTIDNLAVKYGGGHGIHFPDGANNITIRNCEIGWIGGCYLGNTTTRFGNGIEFWNNCSNIQIENNWIYQIYDAGVTHQGNGGVKQTDITYKSNLIEYCTYAIEYFAGAKGDIMKNILIADNILRFAGYGWGMVRSAASAVSLICGWGDRIFTSTNFKIQNNIFDCSDNYLLVQYYNEDMAIEYSGNTYYQKAEKVANWEFGILLMAKDQAGLEKAVAQIESNPKLVKFIG